MATNYTENLQENFQNQLKEIDEKISQIKSELEKANEYRLKLLGGLETIELLMKSEEEIPMPTPDDRPVDAGVLPSAFGETPELEEMEKQILDNSEE